MAPPEVKILEIHTVSYNRLKTIKKCKTWRKLKVKLVLRVTPSGAVAKLCVLTSPIQPM